MKTNKRTGIWTRTLAYLGIAFMIFLLVIAALLWFVGGARDQRSILWQHASIVSQNETAWLNELRAARAAGENLDTWLEQRQARADSRTNLVKRLKDLEHERKNARNEKEILGALDAGYADLRGELRTAGAFDEELASIRQRVVLAFLIVFAALSGVVLILFRMIVGPIETIVKNAKRVAEGHLDVKFSVETGDELGELSRVMESLRTNFRELLALMQNSCTTGEELTDRLQNGSDDETRQKTTHEIKQVFVKMREITEYFTGS